MIPRIIILCFLLAAVIDVAPNWGTAPVDLLVLIDQSASVDRSALLDDGWSWVSRLANSLPEEGGIRALPFAGQTGEWIDFERKTSSATRGLEPGLPPVDRRLNETATNLEQALDVAASALRPDRFSAIVILSDGIETDGNAANALLHLAELDVPVIYRRVPRSTPEREAWIRSVRNPGPLNLGQRVPVTIELESSAAMIVDLTLFVDGQEASRLRDQLDPGIPTEFTLLFETNRTGIVKLEVILETTGEEAERPDRRTILVEVEAPSRVDYLTRDHDVDPPPLAASLSSAGWTVTRQNPRAYRTEVLEYVWETGPAGLIVLDDLAVSDMDTEDWKLIGTQVRNQGTGLLVLGGPNSFSAGGYRNSDLEAFLPVTAQGRKPRIRVAIQFLIDTSGSMDNDENDRDRLGSTHRALSEMLDELDDGDWVGVASFALEPLELIPLGAHINSENLSVALLPSPSGGTKFRPALDLGIASLLDAPMKRRILVVVTDGHGDAGDLSDLSDDLESADIELLILAVGSDVDELSLARLARAGAGHSAGRGPGILRVNEVAELPRVMRKRLSELLEPKRTGVIQPRLREEFPFRVSNARDNDWPTLTNLMLSKPRQHASVHLESEQGDPILAIHRVGLGRVATMPGGLGSWARAWTGWTGWSEFVGELSGWLAQRRIDTGLYIDAKQVPSGILIQIDAIERDRWSRERELDVILSGPGGGAKEFSLLAKAPGKYSALLPAETVGDYSITISSAHGLERRRLRLEALKEDTLPHERIFDRGRPLHELWTVAADSTHRQLQAYRTPMSLRGTLIAASLFAYVAVLIIESERNPTSRSTLISKSTKSSAD